MIEKVEEENSAEIRIRRMKLLPLSNSSIEFWAVNQVNVSVLMMTITIFRD